MAASSFVVCACVLISSMVSTVGAESNYSNFDRVCHGVDASIVLHFPSLTHEQAAVTFIQARDGSKLHFAYTGSVGGRGCKIVVAPGLSSMAAATLEWLLPLRTTTGCDIIVLEYRGFGHSRQPGGDKIGMKIAAIASDFNELLEHVGSTATDIILLGHSMGANIIWAYLQLYHRSGLHNVRGIIPIDGGLVAVPQATSSIASYPVSGAFSWSTMETLTNTLLDSTTPASCFESVYSFFKNPGFFATPDLLDAYFRFLCDFDCKSFGLLNKDSLFADFTDAVVLNRDVFKLPTLVYIPEASVIPASVQEWIRANTQSIPFSAELRLTKEGGGDHFCIVPGAPGRNAMMDALSAFISSAMTI